MDPHLISATMPFDDHQAVIAAIDVLRQKLPFLIDLTSAERGRMAKGGDKTRAFIQKAVEIANEHPQMFPPLFLEEMRKDSQLLDTLSPIRLAIKTLAKKLDDTTMQLGAGAFAAARTVYAVTKAPFAKAILRTASDDLAKRYGRRKKTDLPAQTDLATPLATAAHS
jgi:hypothetical protein